MEPAESLVDIAGEDLGSCSGLREQRGDLTKGGRQFLSLGARSMTDAPSFDREAERGQ